MTMTPDLPRFRQVEHIECFGFYDGRQCGKAKVDGKEIAYDLSDYSRRNYNLNTPTQYLAYAEWRVYPSDFKVFGDPIGWFTEADFTDIVWLGVDDEQNEEESDA